MRMHNLCYRASAFVLALLAPVPALIGCGDPTQPGSTEIPAERAALLSLSPAEQLGSPGLPVSPISVVLRDGRGNPLPSVQVTFTVITGHSRLSPSWQMTDAFGVATADWLLGAPGENVATASVAGIGSVTFRATSVFDHGGFRGGRYALVSYDDGIGGWIPDRSVEDVLSLHPDGSFSRVVKFDCEACWYEGESGFYAIDGQHLVLRYLSFDTGAMQREELGAFASDEIILVENHSSTVQTRRYRRLPDPPPAPDCVPPNPWDYGC